LQSKFIAAPALALALSLSGWAQAPKIAVLDMQGAILQTKEGQAAAAQLKAKFAPKEQEINKRGQDLAAKQEQYRKAANTMSEEAKASAEREVQSLGRNLQRDTDDVRADFQQEENKLLGGILQKMQAVVQKYAVDNQITMVVDISSQPNNLLYADKSVNITADVIALYDKAPAAPAPAAAAPASRPPASGSAPAAPKKTAPAGPGRK
jgi:outer membrane protein